MPNATRRRHEITAIGRQERVIRDFMRRLDTDGYINERHRFQLESALRHWIDRELLDAVALQRLDERID